jgi:hypothetical protein
MSKYNNQIINSTNKMKTTWNIIKSETGRLNKHITNNYKILLTLLINTFRQ